MEPSQFKELLYKYLNRKTTLLENQTVENWYNSYEKEVYVASGVQKYRVKKEMWGQIQKQAGLRGRKIRMHRLITIAAACFFMLGIALVLNKKTSNYGSEQKTSDFINAFTSTGQLKYVVLPDSSTIYLNTNTEVRFKRHFDKKIREVFIQDGEAFFVIRHNPSWPFIVHAGEMNTRVMGTSFNVKAYKRSGTFDVLVKTGMVQVNLKGKELARLSPDRKISIDMHTKTFRQSMENASAYLQWQRKEVTLKNASFEELSLLIWNHYGLKLVAGHAKIQNYQFTISLNFAADVHSFMKQLSFIHHNHFILKGDQIIMY